MRIQTNSTKTKSIVLTGDIGHTQNIYQHTSTLILTILIIIERNETKRKITFNDFVLDHTKIALLSLYY